LREKLVKILRFLSLSDIGITLNEIALHTNTANPLILLEILRYMGHIRKIEYIDQNHQTGQKYKITSSGRNLLLSQESCILVVPLSILEDVLISYELTTNEALRIY
jgi:hypothetical protein